MIEESLRDGSIDGVHPQREVCGEHSRSAALRRIVRIGNGACPTPVFGSPLVGAGRALRELPLIAVQVFEVVVAPFHRRSGPYDLDAAGDRIVAFPAAKGVFPAQTLLLDG